MNVIVRTLRALTNPSISWGEKDDPQITDGNFKINLSRAAASGAESQVKQFSLTSVHDDYVIGRELTYVEDETGEHVQLGAEYIQIAKEPKIRLLGGERFSGLNTLIPMRRALTA